MNEEDLSPKNLIKATQSRPVSQVMVVSSAIGLWIVLSLGRGFSYWAGGSPWRWAAAVVLWPIVWFLALCLYTQGLMFVASVIARIVRFSEKQYEQLVRVFFLTGLSGLAVWDLMQPSMLDRILGGLWVAGWLMLGVVFRGRGTPSA